MADIMITQIGAGGAFQTIYNVLSSDGENIYSKKMPEDMEESYPFMAYMKLKKYQFDEILLVGTVGSGWETLCKRLKSSLEKADIDIEKDDERQMVEYKISAGLKAISGMESAIPVKIILIKNGITDTEINRNFESIKEGIEEAVEAVVRAETAERTDLSDKKQINISFDVSNGFRSFPMLVYAAVNYISVIKQDRRFYMEMYYGMYDSKLFIKGNKDEDAAETDYNLLVKESTEFQLPQPGEKISRKGLAPFVNMTNVYTVVQWTSAVKEFYDNGSVNQIIDLLLTESEDIFCETFKKETYIGALKKFSFAINSCNLSEFIKAKELLIQAKDHIKKGIPVYISDTIDYISEDFARRFKTDDSGSGSVYGKLTLALAKWYCDQGRLGDAVIALQEGMLTYTMEKFSELSVQYINKIDIHAKLENTKDILFDIAKRALIRENVFDLSIDPWKDEYRYICDHIRNPAMKLHYNGNNNGNNEMMENSADDMSVADTHKIVEDFVNEMLEGVYDNVIEIRLQELIDRNYYDVFISYRRNYYGYEDGSLFAQGLRDELVGRGLGVFLDQKELYDQPGYFEEKIKFAIYNSTCFLIVLGHGVFSRSFYYENGEIDVFYNELLTAYEHHYDTEREDYNNIYIACLGGFEANSQIDTDGLAEDDKRKCKLIAEIAQKGQRVTKEGGGDIWGFPEYQKLQQRIAEILLNHKREVKK